MKPIALQCDDVIQVSYEAPHRIYCALVYPRTSPNGSSITVYGHEQGLRIIWRGGKPLRHIIHKASKKDVNGTRDSNAMAIDLDEEESESSSKPMQASFEDEDEEIDPHEPYQKVIRHVDVNLGAEARHISSPAIPADLSHSPIGAYPSIFSTHMIVAAACADSSIRLVTLPLSLPPKDANPSTIGTDIVQIAGLQSHQDLPSSVSITHTGEHSEGDETARSRSRSQGGANPSSAGKAWSFLIASTSPTAGGQLLVHQIPILPSAKLSADNLIPIQKQYLKSSIGCKVLFNPMAYPAEQHSNLLVLYPSGSVKLYQCFQTLNARNPRSRRGSTTTTDSSTSRTSRQGLNGRFTFLLHSPFLESGQSCPRRERILDSSWVLGGRGIIALLESGKWGVCDIEGVGSSFESGSQNLFQDPANPSGITGAALTNFSLTGKILPETEAGPPQPDQQEVKPSTLAPKTPNTRKIQSEVLFKGHASKSLASSEYVRGIISVAQNVDLDSPRSNSPPDESILLAYGEHNVAIPSLSAFWRARKSERGTLDSSLSSRLVTVSKVRLLSGHQVDIAHLSKSKRSLNRHSILNGNFSRSEPPEVLVAFSRRIVFLVRPLKEATHTEADKSHSSKIRKSFSDTLNEDQMLLDHGELDIEGMDRVLQGMNGNALPAASGVQTNSVFGMSMAPPPTPTPGTQAAGRALRQGTRSALRSKAHK
ncbi:MAG: hypothetical protein Q9160_000833 [Pyrenula sp. 1 TL-2023]